MKPTLQLVRPPSTPEEMDAPHFDLVRAAGFVAGAMFLMLFLDLVVTAVFSLVPVRPW